MKRILYAGTALFVFGGMVSVQAAEPVKLSIGGEMKQQVIIADQDADGQASVDQQSNAYVNFKGSAKLDNGLDIAVSVETIASQQADSRTAAGATGNGGSGSNSNIRRAYLTLSSSFGQLILGQREDYGFITANSAPDVGWGLQDGDWSNAIASLSDHSSHLGTNTSRYNARSEKITLVTPSFAGFSAGFSYTPDISQARAGALSMASDSDVLNAGGGLNSRNGLNVNRRINRSTFAGDMYLGGVSYKNKFGDVSLNANAAMGQLDLANTRVYQGGLQASYAGFTLGGSVFVREVPNEATVTYVNGVGPSAPTVVGNNAYAKAVMHAGTSFDVGASYKSGPYAVSLGYFQDKSKRNPNATGGGRADSTEVVALSGRYTMGPGVEWRNSFYLVDFKNNGGFSNDNTENNGFAVMTGVMVKF